MPAANIDPAEFRRRVAFAIMLQRFGKSPGDVPKPGDPVPVDLSTDLLRSLERKLLTFHAHSYLEAHPGFPFTWKPTPHLDLFKNLTFQKYYALCWMQLQLRSLAEDLEEAIRGVDLNARAREMRAAFSQRALDSDMALEILVQASGADVESFGPEMAELPAASEE